MSKVSIQMNDQSIRDRVKENDGYCICSLVRTEDTKCMCKEFRSTEATSEGVTCHCGLYTKYLKEDE